MSVTYKIVNVIDKLKLNNYFIEKNNITYFSPIKIQLNTEIIEKVVNSLINVKGREYKPNKFEKDVLKELDF